MFCANCGKEINSNAVLCVYCGVPTNNTLKCRPDNPSHLAGICSCCCPIIGLILYFCWRDEKPNSAKLICKWMLSVIGTLILIPVVSLAIVFVRTFISTVFSA
ncbi:MAG: zinc ribbon domain-containing protein [Clostridium sp.]|uniref:zinc ribbon domain-containing protein n=1 Tax=Clostridium sp. TaxID=1506 RepID=UPI003D6D49C6